MGIITKGMGAIMKGAKKRKTLTIQHQQNLNHPLDQVRLLLKRNQNLLPLNLQTHGKIDVLMLLIVK